MNNNKLKYNCVFGGGGIRGMCYIGAMRALEELDVEICSFAGSSVGAVFAALSAVGYSYSEIKNLFLDFNFNMFRDINFNIFNNDISISKGEIFLNWLREKLNSKYFGDEYDKEISRRVRFKDLKKNLYILTLDLSTNTPFIFSKETTPEEEIAFAVRASASLPGLMKPVTLGDSILVDGDLIKSWPAWKIYSNLNSSQTRLLEFRLEGSKHYGEIKNPVDYVNSIISSIWYLSTENVYNSYGNNDRYDYIVIDTKDIILFDFTLDKKEKEKLAEFGYKTVKNYFIGDLIKKKKNILKIYEKLHEKILLFLKCMKKKKTEDLLNLINDVLSEAEEDVKYIDISIYNNFLDLKDCLKINIKKGFLFKTTVDNEQQIYERADFIRMLIEEKIDDLQTYITKNCKKC